MTLLRVPRAGDVIRVTSGWKVRLMREIGDDFAQEVFVDEGRTLIVLASVHDRSLAMRLLVASDKLTLGWVRGQYMAGDPDTEWYEFVSEAVGR